MFYFVGAGPGDLDLITIKGRRLLESADIVIFTGSLVSSGHLDFCKSDCEKYSSADMTLEEVMNLSINGIKEGKMVVRLHTGDPSIYGAIKEQMDILDKNDIDYEVIPGVSSFTAACSVVKKEFTIPNLTQTVIITRIEGRTPVPEEEDIEKLARHKASMAIFLSVGSLDRVVEKLIRGYGSDDIDIAIIYKATWPDQKIIKGKLNNIVEKVEKEGIKNFAQILVGKFLEGEYDRSLLYDPEFSHGFRKAEK
ncbi:MAG: precorrin-4 C(11)-methyltransferase [Andreesenia angusta]|nr:precorrin-4 C(11)-methyltransferase [Andreesenia angusta]